MEWFDGSTAKQAAADILHAVETHPGDVVPWEWKADDGTHMLMLEHYC